MISRHAQKRCQQRAIPIYLTEWLMDFGAVVCDHHGGEVHYFDRIGKQIASTLMRQAGMTPSGSALRTYIVSSTTGDLITAGHLTKRINRP